MSRELCETLVGVQAAGEVDAASLAKTLQWPGHVTAINNRLVTLTELGFLTRRKAGKFYLYRPA